MTYGPRFEAALVLAAQLHRDQLRKSTATPYVCHLLSVAAIVGENGGTEDEVIAALLHDAVEDQGGPATRKLILDRFGSNVAEIVDGCTDTDEAIKPAWRQRKETHLAHLAKASPSVMLVTLADKLHNSRAVLADLRTLGEETWQRFKGGKDGTIWYYRSVLSLAENDPRRGLVDEFARVVDEIEQLAR